MPLVEILTAKSSLAVAAAKSTMAGVAKVAIATNPVFLPVVVGGCVGSLLVMDYTTARAAKIIIKNNQLNA
ncbi:hypothetical protein V5T82_16290 [Magnetovibrio sp. PR-2]|uniref:hypothetical protein n=1 Tax=Magnetovibrio sp. PR-2 TaxID=3120356 RepID=UPI002FCE0516